MENEKCSCESCSVKKVLDKIWEPKTKCLYSKECFGGYEEEYETQHICGYYERHEHCAIPGHRDSYDYAYKKYCILTVIQDFANDKRCVDGKTTDEWQLPIYHGSYEDLLNID